MSQANRSTSRGSDVLRATVPFSPDPLRVQLIPVGLIDPDPRQSRTRADAVAVQQLRDSIRERGLLEPIRVRISPDGDRLLAYIGGRRTRAWQQLREQDPERFALIPAYVDEKEDAQALSDSLAENLHREDLSAVEVGQALITLKELRGWTYDQLAEHMDMTSGYLRALTAKTRLVLRSPELAALDLEKPLPALLVLAAPTDAALHGKFADTWRQWGDRSAELLAKQVRGWKVKDAVEDPHSLGGTRIERLRRTMNDLRILRDPAFWEAGLLTPGETALLPNLEYQLRETLQVVERLTSDPSSPGEVH